MGCWATCAEREGRLATVYVGEVASGDSFLSKFFQKYSSFRDKRNDIFIRSGLCSGAASLEQGEKEIHLSGVNSCRRVRPLFVLLDLL